MSKTKWEQFQKLFKETQKLAQELTPADIQRDKVMLLTKNGLEDVYPKLVCENEDDYAMGLLKVIGGDKQPLIVQNPDLETRASLEEDREAAKKHDLYFVIPSVIIPPNTRDPRYYFTPYITFFTHDGKLFMFPYEGEAFSDVLFEERE